ncbi:hypothetical protein GEI7407_1559 [Geitlerinema sp. PCC 7407]|nr:hypothetical protein GEI7407_1559 [Geitlerinema sp. PCC 7407]
MLGSYRMETNVAPSQGTLAQCTPMLIPLTRKKFEDLVPLVASASQYRYFWGSLADILRRVLISIISVVVVGMIRLVIGENAELLMFTGGVFCGFYWLWGPIFWASRRNWEFRKYPYSGFWQGRVLDVFVSEELVGTEETVNKKGELVIVENRERRINLEVGDESGFETRIQVPLKRDHKAIRRGQVVELLVLSNRPDLSTITNLSDAYLPDRDVWVSDYPYVQRGLFVEVSRQIYREAEPDEEPPRERPRRSAPRRSSGRRSRPL